MGGLTRVPSREVAAAYGAIRLFYGCRDDRLDFLYENELRQAQSTGVLTELVLAVSRRPEHGRRYVQDGLRQQAAVIWQLMHEQGAMIFVCGQVTLLLMLIYSLLINTNNNDVIRDATGMARDVNDALVDIIREQAQITETKEALAILADWSKQGRYLRDLASQFN
jgi:sulfite reductase alpha subunit-like flavoprotein